MNISKELNICRQLPVKDTSLFKDISRALQQMKVFVDELYVTSLSQKPEYPEVRYTLLSHMADCVNESFKSWFHVDKDVREGLNKFKSFSWAYTKNQVETADKDISEYNKKKLVGLSDHLKKYNEAKKKELQATEKTFEKADAKKPIIQPTLKTTTTTTTTAKAPAKSSTKGTKRKSQQKEVDSDDEIIKITNVQEEKPKKRRRLVKVKEVKEVKKDINKPLEKPKLDKDGAIILPKIDDEFEPIIKDFNANTFTPLAQSPVSSQPTNDMSDFTEEDKDLSYTNVLEENEKKLEEEKQKKIQQALEEQIKVLDEKRKKEEQEKFKREKEERERIIRIQKEAAEKKIIEEVLNTTIRTVEEQDTMQKEESRQRLIIYLEKKKELDRMQQLYNINI